MSNQTVVAKALKLSHMHCSIQLSVLNLELACHGPTPKSVLMSSQAICSIPCLWHTPQPLLHLIAGPVTNWRWPFVIVALPSLLVTGVMLATTQEPPRGITEPALQVPSLPI